MAIRRKSSCCRKCRLTATGFCRRCADRWPTTATAPLSCRKACAARTAGFWPSPTASMPLATASWAAPGRWWPTWWPASWATHATGRCPTICSARPGTLPRRLTWSTPAPWGGPPWSRRRRNEAYRCDVASEALEDSANHEKMLPPDFIRADGFGITPAARRYLAPLIKGEAHPPWLASGLPDYVRPELSEIAQKLPPFEV